MDKILFLGCSYGFFLASLVFGIWLFKRLYKWNYLDRFMAAWMPITVVIFLELSLRELLAQPSWPINAGRLTPTFALIHGYQLYYSSDTGPILSSIYGPITALSYLPSTLANSPTIAIILASLVSIFFFFIPILWLHIGKRTQSPQQLLLAIYVFIGFCFYTLNSPSLSYSAFRIHADAISLGFSAFACVVLYYRKQKDSIFPLLLSATLAILAIWSKQVALPVVVALPIYIFLADGYRCFKRYVLCIFAVGIIFLVIFASIFNPQILFFNLFTLPGSHPWTSDNKLVALFGSNRKLMQEYLLSVTIIIFCVLSQFLFTDFKVLDRSKLQEWINNNRWIMLAIVGILMIPASAAGNVKVGGDINAFSFTLYFFAASASLGLVKLANSLLPSQIKSFSRATKLIVTISIVIFIFSEFPPPFPTIYRQLQNLNNNSSQIAYEYAKKYPGQAFFPMQPLSTLMAEGKLYHFAHGLFDRQHADVLVTDEHFKAYIPANIKLVAYPGSGKKDEATEPFITKFSQKIKVDELPGLTVYVRQ